MKVIDIMKNGGHSVGAAAASSEVCFLMACDFPRISFEQCNREANKVAHELARIAKYSMTRDWIEEPKILYLFLWTL